MLDLIMGNIQQLLDAVAAKDPEKAFFNLPPLLEVVDSVESRLGLSLPADLRRFLLAHNGGFITLVWSRSHPRFDLATAEWNSNSFLSCDAIATEFERERETAQRYSGWQGQWPFIPFMRTKGQDLLVLGPAIRGTEAPVLDATHEAGPSDWAVLYPSFRALLDAYLRQDGAIQTIAGGQREV